jgi:DNA-binding SARP family transcriptional activator/tetratricopeptide (TPR) repeat protein
VRNSAAETGRVRYRLLGPVTVYGPGGSIRLGGPKQRAVLAVLLLHANRVVAQRELHALVWGENPPRSVRGRLQVHISELRALLGREVIVRIGEGYRINVAPGELDLDLFTDLVARARADQAPAAVARRLRSALALWHGHPLVGVGDTLIGQERPGLEERRLVVLEELYEVELAAGRHAEIVDELSRATLEHPLREGLAAQLMLALYQGERRQAALRVYSVIRRRLADELGVEPGQRLRDMQARILGSEDTAIRAPVDTETGHLPTAAGHIGPAELPRDIRGFAGRADALTVLNDQLTAAEPTVCVISGVAGVGKTALAVRWAHSVRERFPDGQLYLNLRGYDPDDQPMAPMTALTRLLRSLGVDPHRLSSTLAEQEALYRSLLADRRVLVVLDNAREASQVLPLLPPTGMTVVTSRHGLAQIGARAISLDTLTDHEAHELLEAMIGRARVRAELASATELAGLCGGLPLALRLVAAHLVGTPQARISAVAAELAHGDRLAAFAPDGAERSVVKTAFSASYHALDPARQRLFRLLGLIPGPDFTASTAAALAAIPVDEAIRGLDELADAHVIEQHASDRYRFHDLVRLYAVEQVRNDSERDPAWSRLVSHYLDIIIAATDRFGAGRLALPLELPNARFHPDWVSSESQVATLDAEIPNVMAAATPAARQGPYPVAWLVADRLRTYFHRNGRRGEWSEVARAILAEASRQDAREARAMLHYSIGDSCFTAGQRDDGIHHLTKAVDVALSCGWRECEAAALAALGVALAWTGQLAEATKHTQKAAALFSKIGSVVGENRTLKNLGGQYHLAGKLRLAEECYLQALDLSAQHGPPLAWAADLAHLGSVRLVLGRNAAAKSDLVLARDMFTGLGSKSGLALTWFWLGRLRWEEHDREQARQEIGQALELARQGGAKLIEVFALVGLVEIEIDMSQYRSAESYLSLVGDTLGHNEFLFHRGYIFAVAARIDTHRGRHEEAVGHARKALSLARQGGYRPTEIAALRALTEAYLHSGKPRLAAASGRATLALCRECGDALQERWIRRLLDAQQ